MEELHHPLRVYLADDWRVRADHLRRASRPHVHHLRRTSQGKVLIHRELVMGILNGSFGCKLNL